MAGGWAQDGAVQEQIDATVEDAVQRARSQIQGGPERSDCAECGQPIPEARRKALPGVQFCISCQAARDESPGAHTGYNRRGSKDSQLR